MIHLFLFITGGDIARWDRWRLCGLLRDLCVLFDFGSAKARSAGRLQQRDAEFCGATHRHHSGGVGGAQACMSGDARA